MRVLYVEPHRFPYETEISHTLKGMQQVVGGLIEPVYLDGDGVIVGNEEAKPLGKIVKVPESITYKEALKNTTIFTSTVMFDMNYLTKEDIKMPNIKSEDTALWWKLLRENTKAYGLNENLVIYRRPSKSLSSNKFEAIKRIWYLYREWEKLSLVKSAYYFVGWAFRAVLRRI